MNLLKPYLEVGVSSEDAMKVLVRVCDRALGKSLVVKKERLRVHYLLELQLLATDDLYDFAYRRMAYIVDLLPSECFTANAVTFLEKEFGNTLRTAHIDGSITLTKETFTIIIKHFNTEYHANDHNTFDA